MASELERIAAALETIVQRLDEVLPPPILSNPPDRPFGADAVSYLDDEQLWQIEQEQTRLKERGLPETVSSDD